MKIRPFLYLLVLVSLVSSCEEEIATNTPALQGTLNDLFFKAIDARATEFDDGSFLIQGVTQRELLSLRVRKGQPGVYRLGQDTLNYGTFQDNAGDIYDTHPDGSGEIVISSWDEQGKTLSGSFSFTAILPGADTLTVQRGIFFEVPYEGILVEQPTDDPPANAGTFVADINGATFNPFDITATLVDDQIVIRGLTPTTEIAVGVPVSVTLGNYMLPATGFSASYTKNGVTEAATTGNVIIIAHEPSQNTIKGTFSFRTASHVITRGQFNVVYR